jgi:hypothetical protein
LQWNRENASTRLRKLHGITIVRCVRAVFEPHENNSLQERALFGCDLGHSSALAVIALRNWPSAAELGLIFACGVGRWWGSFRFAVSAAEFANAYFDRDGDVGRRTARMAMIRQVPALMASATPAAAWALAGSELGGWTARDARVGSRTDEFVPDHASRYMALGP